MSISKRHTMSGLFCVGCGKPLLSGWTGWDGEEYCSNECLHKYHEHEDEMFPMEPSKFEYFKRRVRATIGKLTRPPI